MLSFLREGSLATEAHGVNNSSGAAKMNRGEELLATSWLSLFGWGHDVPVKTNSLGIPDFRFYIAADVLRFVPLHSFSGSVSVCFGFAK